MKTHSKTHTEIVHAFSLPEQSKERKILFEKIGNKGNFRHDAAVLQGETGPLKVKRKSKAKHWQESLFTVCTVKGCTFIRSFGDMSADAPVSQKMKILIKNLGEPKY